MNSTGQEETEISIKNLFLYPVYHWKNMLVMALIILLFGCIFIGVLTYKMNSEPKPNADTELIEYIAKKNDLEGQVNFLRATVEGQQNYLDHSIRIKIDPYKTWHAKCSFYVDTDYKIMPEMTYQNPDRAPIISSALVDLLMSSQTREKIASAQNMDVLQLDELYWIESGENTISIDVVADTESRANSIMDMLKAELYAGEIQLNKGFGSFEIKETLSSIYEEVNTSILNDKNELLSTMGENHEKIVKLRDELKHLSEPDNNTAKVVKRTILLVVASLILPYGYYCIKFILNNRLYSSNDMAERWNINILGAVSAKDKYALPEKWARSLEERAALPDEEAYKLAASNICNYSSGISDILAVGDASEALCKAVTEKLQENLPNIRLQYHGSFLCCAESAAALGNCEAVIMIEQCGVSKTAHICQEIKQINALQKPLIGCFVVDL